MAPGFRVWRDSPQHIRGDLDEWCHVEAGLGVYLLRMYPGERLSPRWPLQEPHALLLCWSHVKAEWGQWCGGTRSLLVSGGCRTSTCQGLAS